MKAVKFICLEKRNIKSHSFRIVRALWIYRYGCLVDIIKTKGRWCKILTSPTSGNNIYKTDDRSYSPTE